MRRNIERSIVCPDFLICLNATLIGTFSFVLLTSGFLSRPKEQIFDVS